MTAAPSSKALPELAADRGERARTRLLLEASRIFSEKGYAKASTREICEAARLNPAAIHYHFGDKDGLYRAVLLVPIHGIAAQLAGFDDPALTLAQSLHHLLRGGIRIVSLNSQNSLNRIVALAIFKQPGALPIADKTRGGVQSLRAHGHRQTRRG